MKLNLGKVNKAIDKAFKATVDAYAEKCTEAIESEIWEWDGTTKRRNGDVAGSPRDIVDLGNLRDSQTIEIDGDVATVSYEIDYAAAVHEGRVTSNGSIVPGRPWLNEAAQNTDFQGTMARVLKQELP